MTNKPAPDELTQKSDDLGELYAHAQMLKDFYDHTLDRYARQTGGEYHSGPIKTLGRAMDKVSTDYTDKDTGQQRPERVKDLLRSSIVYMSARDLARGVRKMKTLAPGIQVRNVKNKFKKGQARKLGQRAMAEPARRPIRMYAARAMMRSEGHLGK